MILKGVDVKKINILHVGSIIPVGGVGTYLKNVIKYIDKNKHNFSFVFCDEHRENSFESFASDYGYSTYYAGKLKAFNLINVRKWFNVFFRQKKYDIVEIHSPNVGFLCANSAKKSGAKVVFHFHSTKYSSNLLKGFRNYIIELPITRWGDYYIACGVAVAKAMIKSRKIKEEEYSIIQNAIEMKYNKYDENSISSFRSQYVSAQGKLCLAVGNCVKEKNYTFLVEVFENLMGKNIVLLIAGEGNQKEKLSEIIEEKKINNIILLGYRNDISFLMSAADLFVMPSLMEGLPVAAIEAQLYGLPMLVSSNITNEIKVNDNVVFLDLNKPAKVWAETMIEMANVNKEDNYRILKSMFNIKNQIIRIEEVYKIIVG